MTGTNGVLMPDNFKLKFGDATTPDLQIYHDGSNSYISDGGTGDLYIQGSDDIYITAANGEKFITCNTNDSVEIRYDNVKKFETTSTGVSVTGAGVFTSNVTANGIYTAGNSAIIYKAQRTGGAVAGDWSYDDATTDMSLGTSTAHSFSLKTGNTRALTINSSQNAKSILLCSHWN